MADQRSPSEPETSPTVPSAVTVRYWASARSAAGVDHEQVAVDGTTTLAALRLHLARVHAGGRLTQVLDACSVLVGDRPVNTEDPDDVAIAPGATVEFLPPFAGG